MNLRAWVEWQGENGAEGVPVTAREASVRTEAGVSPFGINVPHREPARFYQPLERIAGKTSVPALTAYLQDPLPAHPDGRMPSLALTPREARSISLYILDHFRRYRRRGPGQGPRPAAQGLF